MVGDSLTLVEQPLGDDMGFDVGDLIEFYNKDFLKKFKSKIMEFKNKKIRFGDTKLSLIHI